jgi:hypothetical protein
LVSNCATKLGDLSEVKRADEVVLHNAETCIEAEKTTGPKKHWQWQSVTRAEFRIDTNSALSG